MMKAGLFALVAMVCALGPGLAQARPRDDVMAGAFRCAAIGDSRQWLDCYYGAAQPVRAGLGLAPPSAAQLRLAQSPPPGEAADTALRDAVMAGAFGCNSYADDRQWLDCYYAAAQPVRTGLGLSPAPQVRMAVAAPALPPAQPVAGPPRMVAQDFGLRAPATDKRVDRVVSRMASYSFDRYGIFTATLANGQVWQQLSGDTNYARWNKPAETYVVNISHGLLGSYKFQVKDSPGMYKVRRER
jgi:hypothetical protein